MDIEVNKKIPVIFQRLNTYETEDTRFMPVKIWLMHLGENFNGSYFSKEVVQDAIPSLANTPILAYIEKNSEDENDFSDHRQVLVKEECKYKIKYIGQAIGVIPETNNAKFEIRLCDDGIEREFLTLEGLVWQNKWDDAPDILSRDSTKAQSMELHNDYEGDWGEDNLFHFTKFKFYGACGLGNEVSPAMINSTIEVQFTLDEFTKQIQEKVEEFKLKFSLDLGLDNSNFNKKSLQEGGETVDEKLELIKKYNLTQEQLNFSIDELTVDELENKLEEFTKDKEKEVKDNFTLSNQQLETEIRKELNKKIVIIHDYWGDPYEENMYYFRDVKDSFAIVISNDWSTYYGIPFTVNGDIVALDFENMVEYVSDWRPKQSGETINSFAKIEFDNKLKTSIEKATDKAKSEFNIEETEEYKTLNQSYETLKTDYSLLEENNKNLNKQLSSYQANEIEDKKEAIYSSFSDAFSEDEMSTIKEETKDIDIENLENELYTYVGKKKYKFSKTEKKDKAVVKIPTTDDSAEDNPYPALTHIFNKIK